MKKKQPTQKQIIIWNLVNSFLAGCLVFLGTFTNGSITKEGLIVAIATALIVAITKFKDFWAVENNSSLKLGIFNFIH